MGGGQELDGRLEPFVGAAVEFDDFAAQCGEDVLVRTIAGPGQSHPVADVEAGEERRLERAGGSGGHGDAVGRDVESVPIAVVGGDGLAQFGDAEDRRVAESRAVAHDLGGAGQHGAGCTLGRFAKTHGNGVATRPLHLPDGGDDAHRGEGFDESRPGRGGRNGNDGGGRGGGRLGGGG